MYKGNGFYTPDFINFWKSRIDETSQPPLIISGVGFDPRSMLAANIFLEIGCKPKFIPIRFNVESSAENEEVLKKTTDSNLAQISKYDLLCDPLEVEMYDGNNRPVGGRKVIDRIYGIRKKLDGINDLILDIGGLPRSLFAPLLSYLINRQYTNLGFSNLHVASLPDAGLDHDILSDEILAPNNMYGFEGLNGDDKIVWLPIIGSNDPNRLRKIYGKIAKNCIEICPILPFRPNNPREIDKLLFELSDVLFNEMRTINNNIIYIDHTSPFAVSKEIVEISNYYKKMLENFKNNVKVLISPLADKTTCVGAVLAAVHSKLPIMHADTISYRINNSQSLLNKIEKTPVEIWISGDAYES